MTQKELATFVGISTPTLQKFEDKKTNITLDACLKILQALDLANYE